MTGDKSCVRLCPFSFGIAFGITNAIGVVLLAFLAMHFGYANDVVHEIASVYHGYAASYMGALYGGIWALVDGFIFGIIVAFIYNCCSGCCCRKKQM